MKKNFALLICLVCMGIWSCVGLRCRTKEQYEISKTSIEKQLRKENSPLLINQLQLRFIKLDTSLSENELKLIYYGQLLKPGFSGYHQPRFSEINDDISNKQFADAEHKIDSILLIEPINLTANYLKSYVVSEINSNLQETKIRIFLMNKLFDAILSTGDGQDKKNAIDVVSIADEYFICYNILLTGNIMGQSLINSNSRIYDKLVVESNENYKPKEVWFDITNIYEAH